MNDTFDLATLDRVVELANRHAIRIRPYRDPQTGVEHYLFDRATGAPIDGPTFMIDQAIASSQARRRSA